MDLLATFHRKKINGKWGKWGDFVHGHFEFVLKRAAMLWSVNFLGGGNVIQLRHEQPTLWHQCSRRFHASLWPQGEIELETDPLVRKG